MEPFSFSLDPEAVVHGLLFTASMMAGRVLVTPREDLERAWRELRQLLSSAGRR